ncbi:MAG: T9SS type A sorting domain-containing protein [Chlorobi bacterium]|nr:T9SS type A sorting domain-containing protein [Chlorobiota bacterium]
MAMAVYLIIALPASLTAQRVSSKGNPPRKISINDDYNFFDVNNIKMWLSNNGDMSYSPLDVTGGLEWPKGSGKHVVYEDGIVIGGIIDSSIHVAGSTFRHGFQAGKILPDGTADNPDNPRYRVYKATRMTEREFAQLDQGAQEILKRDFLEWPVADGAPFFDANGNGTYDPDFDAWLKDNSSSDSPLFVGDQVLWYVANDLDEERSVALYGTTPIGLELQTTVWGYASEQVTPLNDIVFTRYVLINKGQKDLTQCYLTKWSDNDLGWPSDDLVGVDTTRNLGFAYNDRITDKIYPIPPSLGYLLLQGPIVPANGSTAHFNFGTRAGYRNLDLSSFNFIYNAHPVYNDPLPRSGYREMYNLQKGLRLRGQPHINPLTGDTTVFPFSGDPVSGTGWINTLTERSGNNRLLISTGPFTLARGDTQEFIIATIIARGHNNIHSIKVLRKFVDYASSLHERNFKVDIAPFPPVLDAAIFPDKIILHWADPQSLRAVESYNNAGYAFQGYNLYQLTSRDQKLSDATRIATFDLKDSVGLVYDDVYHPESGLIDYEAVQFGSNSGIRRSWELTIDSIYKEHLVRHKPYYFALTWYAYNPDPEARPRAVESQPAIIEVIPQRPDPGTRYGMEPDQRVPVQHEAGLSTGDVLVSVLDPLALTGHRYEVTFSSSGTVQSPYDADNNGTPDTTLVLDNTNRWHLKDLDDNRFVFRNAQGFTGLDNPLIVDGFRIGVEGLSYYVQYREIKQVQWEGSPPVFDHWAGTVFEPGYAFLGSSIPGYEIHQTVEIRFDRNRKSKGYSYPRGGRYGFAYKGYYESPITVWDVSDPDNPRQISYAFSEQSGGPFDNDEWMPGNYLGDREYLYILDLPYNDVPDSRLTRLNIVRDADQFPVLYAGWFLRKWNYRQKDPQHEKENQDYPWQDGAVWRIVPNVPFSEQDRYTFTTIAPVTRDAAIARKDVERINVFPNPYMAKNDWETSKYERFVTFTHLPQRATIRVFTLTGTLVRTIMKDDPSQTIRWNLKNASGYPVGAGMYIIHVDMPELGTSKVLKLAVVQEVQILDSY